MSSPVKKSDLETITESSVRPSSPLPDRRAMTRTVGHSDRRRRQRTLRDEYIVGTSQALSEVIAISEHQAIPLAGRVCKRGIDIAGAGVAIIALMPLFILVAIAINLDSKGALFFGQERVTQGGRIFKMWKFRTMVPNAEQLKATLANQNEMNGPVFKIKHDPRITRVGRFLRRHSIDELPQLLNVLVGDLSLVGPRPALLAEILKYREWQTKRMTVTAGLTCIWQVSGRNQIKFEDWMRMDIRYIDQWSLWLDIKLIFLTIRTVIKGDGS